MLTIINEKALNISMIDTTKNGHFDIVVRLVKLGAESYRVSADKARENGHIEVAEKILELEKQNSTIFDTIYR